MFGRKPKPEPQPKKTTRKRAEEMPRQVGRPVVRKPGEDRPAPVKSRPRQK